MFVIPVRVLNYPQKLVCPSHHHRPKANLDGETNLKIKSCAGFSPFFCVLVCLLLRKRFKHFCWNQWEEFFKWHTITHVFLFLKIFINRWISFFYISVEPSCWRFDAFIICLWSKMTSSYVLAEVWLKTISAVALEFDIDVMPTAALTESVKFIPMCFLCFNHIGFHLPRKGACHPVLTKAKKTTKMVHHYWIRTMLPHEHFWIGSMCWRLSRSVISLQVWNP